MANRIYNPSAGKKNNSSSQSDLIDSTSPRPVTISGSGAINIDWSQSSFQMLTLTGNATLTFSNQVQGKTYVLLVIQGGAGGYNITSWSSAVKWSYNVPPIMGTAVGKKHLISFFYDGTDLLGTYADNF